VGGAEPMEEFLRAYVLFFRRHSLTSERFRAFFNEYFSLRVPAATLASIDWDTWLYKPGMPICLPQVSRRRPPQQRTRCSLLRSVRSVGGVVIHTLLADRSR
jgi:hypothetical protein